MAEATEHVFRAVLRAEGVRSRDVPTSAGRVHALEAPGRGHRPTLVLVHGFGAAAVHFAQLLRLLRPHFRRVLAPDFLAHGFSERRPEVGDPMRLVDGMREAIDGLLDDERVILYGNSMGGYGAIRYTCSRPSRVSALVLNSPAGAPATDDELTRLRATFEMERHDQALDFVDRLYVEPPRLRQVIAWSVRRRFSRPHLRRILQSIEPHHALTPEELSAIAAPTLLMWGSHERILPSSGLDFYREHLPAHAHIEVPQGYGHSPYLERPVEIAERIVRFVDEHAHDGPNAAAMPAEAWDPPPRLLV